MKRYNIIFAAAMLALSGCSLLDPYPTEIRDEDYVISHQKTMQGLVDKCYDYMATNYNTNDGAYLDCLTDNAVITSRTSIYSRMAVGITQPTDNPFSTYWEQDYKGIYNVNLFIQNENGRNVRYMVDEHFNKLLTDRLWGEAHALRAWFYFDLLTKFGGRGTDGNLLGVPLVLEPVELWKQDAEEIRNFEFPRASYDDCVKQILSDCDTAIAYLPMAHRDFLVEDVSDLRVLGSRCYGRLDGVTMTAVKALLYLTWASPLFNPDGDVTRWQKAAEYAKEVIDFKIEVDGAVAGGFDKSRQVNWFDPNNPCIIYASRYTDKNDAMEKMFYPGGFQGDGKMGATQDLVDAFGMADGYPLGQSPTYAYDPQNPYVNRDPRFYSVIFYNGRTIQTGSSTPLKEYTFENWSNGGKDAAWALSTNSLTNYHIKKFTYSGLNWSESSVEKMPRCKFFIRWAHIVLAFAEAANHAVGPTGEIDGLSAKTAISYLRSRNTYDGEAGIKNDPYLDEIALAGEAAFDKFLRNERRIETCFEGRWFFDLRRWSTSLADLNKDVHGVQVELNEDGSFTYDTGYVIETRQFRSAYLPIPYTEMLTLRGLVQNEGWENWQ